MKAAFPHSAQSVPASRQAGLCLAELTTGKANTVEKGEGKIKEDGTMSGRFRILLLSAHCLGKSRAAPWFSAPRAAISRKALTLQGFERHHRRRWAVFRRFGLESRP